MITPFIILVINLYICSYNSANFFSGDFIFFIHYNNFVIIIISSNFFILTFLYISYITTGKIYTNEFKLIKDNNIPIVIVIIITYFFNVFINMSF